MMPMPTLVRQQLIRHQGRIELVVRYLTGQGILQVLNVLNGFLLIRWLNIEELAKFSLAMGVQAMVNMLGDLGFGGLLIGLIGKDTNNRALIGKYIDGIKFYKNIMLSISVVIGACLVAVYRAKHNWSSDFFTIYILLVLGVHAQSQIGYYSAIIQIKKKLNQFYKPQISSALMRTIITCTIYYFFNLNAITSIVITTCVFVYNAHFIKKCAQPFFDKSKSTPIEKREIIKIISPSLPMTLFYTVQGQFTTFLIGMYGVNQNIAEIGGLSRLGQIFAFITPFTSIIIVPYVARLDEKELQNKFFNILSVSLAIPTIITFTSFLYPKLYLAILGPKFHTLNIEIGIFMLSCSINHLIGVIYSMNIARRWNFWSTSIIYVITISFVEVCYIHYYDMAVMKNILLMGVFTSLCALMINFSVSIKGLFSSKLNSI